MSDLEELGLLFQPYTSAGRVPTEKGFRLYVDSILDVHELSDEESRAFLDPEAHFGLLTSKSLDRKAGYTRLQRIIALHP